MWHSCRSFSVYKYKIEILLYISVFLCFRVCSSFKLLQSVLSFPFGMSDRCKLAMKILPLAAPSLLNKDRHKSLLLSENFKILQPVSPSEVF